MDNCGMPIADCGLKEKSKSTTTEDSINCGMRIADCGLEEKSKFKAGNADCRMRIERKVKVDNNRGLYSLRIAD